MSTPFASVDTAYANGGRHAALLLHAMTPQDRTWVLDALPPSEREELSAMLAELEALGIERDAALLEQATAAFAARLGDESRTNDPRLGVPLSDETWLKSLGKDHMQALAFHLRAEPAGLVAELLRVNDWPWRGVLLQKMEPVVRRRVETAMELRAPSTDVPPALRAALIGALAQRLREHAAKATQLETTRRPSSWRHALAQWLNDRRPRLGGRR